MHVGQFSKKEPIGKGYMDPRLMVVKNQKTIFDHCFLKSQRIDQGTYPEPLVLSQFF
jgi:hypothetical protein